MLIEHEQGRAFVRALSDAAQRYAQGDASAVPALVHNTLGYVNLLRQHIEKENQVLFPLADQVLSPTDQEQLTAAFERIETERIGRREHERYHALIAECQKIVAEW